MSSRDREWDASASRAPSYVERGPSFSLVAINGEVDRTKVLRPRSDRRPGGLALSLRGDQLERVRLAANWL